MGHGCSTIQTATPRLGRPKLDHSWPCGLSSALLRMQIQRAPEGWQGKNACPALSCCCCLLTLLLGNSAGEPACLFQHWLGLRCPCYPALLFILGSSLANTHLESGSCPRGGRKCKATIILWLWGWAKKSYFSAFWSSEFFGTSHYHLAPPPSHSTIPYHTRIMIPYIKIIIRTNEKQMCGHAEVEAIAP